MSETYSLVVECLPSERAYLCGPIAHSAHPYGRATLLAQSAHPMAGFLFTSPGLAAILRERLDQVEIHNFTPAHDMGHAPGDLGLAAKSYLDTAIDQLHGIRHDPAEKPESWPWADMFKPTDARGNIIKAAAILWALLDRIDNGVEFGRDELGKAVEPEEFAQPALDASDGKACVLCGCTEHRACTTVDGPCGWSPAFRDVPVCTKCAPRAKELAYSLGGARPYGLQSYTCADRPFIAERTLHFIEVCRVSSPEALEYIENLVADAGPQRARSWVDTQDEDIPF